MVWRSEKGIIRMLHIFRKVQVKAVHLLAATIRGHTLASVLRCAQHASLRTRQVSSDDVVEGPVDADLISQLSFGVNVTLETATRHIWPDNSVASLWCIWYDSLLSVL